MMKVRSAYALDRQRLQLLAPPADDLPQPRTERHRAIGDLRGGVFHHPLPRLQPTRAMAIAIAGARRCAAPVIVPCGNVVINVQNQAPSSPSVLQLYAVSARGGSISCARPVEIVSDKRRPSTLSDTTIGLQ